MAQSKVESKVKKKKRPVVKRKRKKKKTISNKSYLLFVTIVVALYLLFIFRFSLYRGTVDIHTKVEGLDFITPFSEQRKIDKVFKKFDDYVFGADFSHYQGLVYWSRIDTFANGKPVDFVIVRATMGHNGRDMFFRHNWKRIKERKIIRGAYHYYRPNENSLKQAQNFIKRVKLEKGDLPPIFDIERRPRVQSIERLRVGLQRWLKAVEEHYGVKPILYTSDRYFRSYLSKKDFKDYILWIANYNDVRHPRTGHWKMWQFTDKGNLTGVDGFVDFNVFRGNREELEEILFSPVQE